jgi:outer membrane lipoprotein-sorting protein
MPRKNTRWIFAFCFTLLALAAIPLAAQMADSDSADSDTAAATTAGAAGAITAADISLDELIANTIETRGGLDAMQAIKSIRMSGKMSAPGQEFPIVIELKRPNLARVQLTIQGASLIQAYDGEIGWMLAPMMGVTEPQKMPQAELDQFKQMADFDGALVDYAAKGYTLELLGIEDVEGTEAYKLKVTYDTGLEATSFIDKENFVEFQQKSSSEAGGQTVNNVTTMGDFKMVDGVLFAHSIETNAEGAPFGRTITIETIETNVKIDDSLFAMPEAEEAVKETTDDAGAASR